MADNTKIEWTDTTWNPVTGCALVSEGCRLCYAARMAGTRLKGHPSREGLARQSANGEWKFTGEVRLNEEWMAQPLRWRKPRRIFVCAHGDLFAEGVPDEWIDRVFAVMALCPQHVFQVLTKRPERMRRYIDSRDLRVLASLNDEVLSHVRPPVENKWPLPNVWLGTSVEDQEAADLRIPALLAAPAALRFISAEPLLGPLKLTEIDVRPYHNSFRSEPRPLSENDPLCRIDALSKERAPWEFNAGVDHGFLDWVICGGESGKGARPMHPDWARGLRDQCAAAGVPFFFKQWGEWEPTGPNFSLHSGFVHPEGKAAKWPRPEGFGEYGPAELARRGFRHMSRVGKKCAGRLLDDVEHNEFPERK